MPSVILNNRPQNAKYQYCSLYYTIRHAQLLTFDVWNIKLLKVLVIIYHLLQCNFSSTFPRDVTDKAWRNSWNSINPSWKSTKIETENEKRAHMLLTF